MIKWFKNLFKDREEKIVFYPNRETESRIKSNKPIERKKVVRLLRESINHVIPPFYQDVGVLVIQAWEGRDTAGNKGDSNLIFWYRWHYMPLVKIEILKPGQTRKFGEVLWMNYQARLYWSEP